MLADRIVIAFGQDRLHSEDKQFTENLATQNIVGNLS